MKYQIDQVVYSIASRCGKIEINALKIESIGKEKQSNKIYYSGTVINDPELIPDTQYQDRLFPTVQDAIKEIEKQIELLRG